MSSLLTPELLRRGLNIREPLVLRPLSPANHQPAATGNSTPKFSERVRLLSPLPGGEGQGEGERHTNQLSNSNQVKGMIVRGMKNQPEEFCFPIPLTIIPLTTIPLP